VELSCVLIGFSRRGGEERKGDGLHFGLRVGVRAESGHRCAVLSPVHNRSYMDCLLSRVHGHTQAE
jgi:hypothetical protein